ncbi:WD domain-containing protein [Drepanopeziza brunnea f. sp. 'multigermtubi' MB_m1]|uniref:WD domain-containing protein n=1 Tax=Marssonina brunnea f. sp. multigermtubi (strain MB_m1) TaxID=1072389 RepID=K1XT77_MARBU|nr:WD domain-containing protein [Drepanopeziza brunnea f. sp. 'multigermtubi' MB_m1]EKD15669.1 WD domain-containing protein [Drepanopeziza brunnea f. sp. 'multigermtubi' MB_m1]
MSHSPVYQQGEGEMDEDDAFIQSPLNQYRQAEDDGGDEGEGEDTEGGREGEGESEGEEEEYGDEDEDEDEDEGGDDGISYDEIEVEIDVDEVEDDDGEGQTPDYEAQHLIGQRRLLAMLRSHQVRRMLRLGDIHLEEEDEGDDSDAAWWGGRRQRTRPDPNRFPKVPSEKGAELMNSGAFGADPAYTVTSIDRNRIGKKKLALRILDRELAIESPARQRLNKRLMAQDMIPASNADMVISYDLPVYSGQFSDDGNFFFSANKDYKVRMYDTSNPYKWRYYKTVEYPMGQWTLTDASLSPDNKYLAYTSIQSQVCLAPTDPNDMGDPYVLDLALTEGATGRNYRSFGIWSIRYSGDGRQLVAGTTGGSVVLYDIESRRQLHRIYGHDDDVNAVCFADKSSPHILYSGSDDTTLKVWDTRSMGESRSAGAFIGHTEGLTYIDSKGDGRYILSNGKDQTMKLWDLRMVMPSEKFESINPHRRVNNGERFDYRWGSYDMNDWYQDPDDNSVVTFRGHRVLRTLIRCHFSPPSSTNSRYVYSGSEDGKVFIYNMDATLAGTIDVYSATQGAQPISADDEGVHPQTGTPWRTCVRDASWHPNAPIIVASAWNGYGMSSGTCTVHSWNDGAEDDEAEPKMGHRVNQRLVADPIYHDRLGTTTATTPATTMTTGGIVMRLRPSFEVI